MGNALGRDIQPGEKVVVHKHIFHGADVPLADRVFICESGYGLLADSDGRNIQGRWDLTGKEDTIFGFWIDKAATEEL